MFVEGAWGGGGGERCLMTIDYIRGSFVIFWLSYSSYIHKKQQRQLTIMTKLIMVNGKC